MEWSGSKETGYMEQQVMFEQLCMLFLSPCQLEPARFTPVSNLKNQAVSWKSWQMDRDLSCLLAYWSFISNGPMRATVRGLTNRTSRSGLNNYAESRPPSLLSCSFLKFFRHGVCRPSLVIK